MKADAEARGAGEARQERKATRRKSWGPRAALVTDSNEEGGELQTALPRTGSQERWGRFEKRGTVRAAQAAARAKPSPQVSSLPLKKVENLSPKGFPPSFPTPRGICLFPTETCLSPFWSLKIQNKLPNKGTLCSVVLSLILLQGQSQDSTFLMTFTANSTEHPTPSFLLRLSQLPPIVVDILMGKGF